MVGREGLTWRREEDKVELACSKPLEEVSLDLGSVQVLLDASIIYLPSGDVGALKAQHLGQMIWRFGVASVEEGYAESE